MTIDTVEAVTLRFLKSISPEVLVLNGEWGVGKTHFWRNFIRKHKNEFALPYYCYVSLFGISSVSDIRNAIFTKTQEVKRIGVKLDAKTINSDWFGIMREKGLNTYRRGQNFLKELPYGKTLTIGLETIIPNLIQNTVVCLDDFERIASDSVKHEEILGLISELKEEKGCKVVLIFNEKKMGETSTYTTYREKVVDIELIYDPTPEEAAEIGIDQYVPNRELVKGNCVSLGIKNIRVLKKIADLVKTISVATKGLHPELMKQSIHTLVLLAWCRFDTSGERPSFDFIKRWSRIEWGFSGKAEKEVDEKIREWVEILQEYGLTGVDEFDLAIQAVIERGYLEETGFVEAANVKDIQFSSFDLEKSFEDAWSLFHDTFGDNEDQLVSTLTSSFKRAVKGITPLNLSGTTSLLRELGNEEIADELIDFYMQERADETKLFDLSEYPFLENIQDPVVREKFAAKMQQCKVGISLREAVSYIVEHRGWSKAQINALQAADASDYYELFKQEHGRELRSLVTRCLEFSNMGGAEFHAIGKKAREALVRIGRESKINSVRVGRYGITEEELAVKE